MRACRSEMAAVNEVCPRCTYHERPIQTRWKPRYWALLALSVSSLLLFVGSGWAQGTAFTYQGRLTSGGSPVTGSYDLTFTLFTTSSGGSAVAGPLTESATPVTNGLFTVTLDMGTGVFNGTAYWLEIAARTNGGGSFTTLAPRQQLTPAPYAIFAENVGSGGLAGGTYSNPVVFNNSGNSFSGNGSGLTGLNASQLTSGTVPKAALSNAWTTTGNAGTTPAANFIGTTDPAPLDLKAAGARGLELRDSSRSSGFLSGIEGMNVIGGGYYNYVDPDSGVLGATIAGGGYSFGSFFSPTIVSNAIYSDLGSIGGGAGNTIGYSSTASVIAGGTYNADWNGSTNSAIGGGSGNQVYSTYSVIGGGLQNTIGSGGTENFLGGGYGNTIRAGVTGVTVGGGIGNVTGPGGYGTSYASVVGGGHNNNAEGDYSVVPGGDSNWSPGVYSFAAGRRAKATNPDQFVWADSQNSDFSPNFSNFGMGTNAFCVRAKGGVLFTGVNAYNSSDGQTVYWEPGGGSWFFTSDQNVKDRITAVDPQAVLDKIAALPITEWSYKGYSQRHIGPMAQAFHALFPLNDNDKSLNELDLHGVELTAIKGLNQKVDSESAVLRAENAELKQQLGELKRLVTQLSRKLEDQ